MAKHNNIFLFLFINQRASMSILLSRSCEYAIQSILYIASMGNDTPVQQREISKTLNIPSPFLGKILQSLVHSKILVSQKGKSGGFLLVKPAKEIYLYEIMKIVEGDNFLEGCFLGFPGCNDDAPCPLHNHWKKAKENILELLKKSNLEELSKGLESKIREIAKLCNISGEK